MGMGALISWQLERVGILWFCVVLSCSFLLGGYWSRSRKFSAWLGQVLA